MFVTSRQWRAVLVGAAFCALPTLAAVLLLVFGISSPGLTLIYASIAASLVALPAFVYGIIHIVRAFGSGQDDG